VDSRLFAKLRNIEPAVVCHLDVSSVNGISGCGTRAISTVPTFFQRGPLRGFRELVQGARAMSTGKDDLRPGNRSRSRPLLRTLHIELSPLENPVGCLLRPPRLPDGYMASIRPYVRSPSPNLCSRQRKVRGVKPRCMKGASLDPYTPHPARELTAGVLALCSQCHRKDGFDDEPSQVCLATRQRLSTSRRPRMLTSR